MQTSKKISVVVLVAMCLVSLGASAQAPRSLSADDRAAIHETLFDLVLEHAIDQFDVHVAPRARDVLPAIADWRRRNRRPPFHRHDADPTGAWNDPALGESRSRQHGDDEWHGHFDAVQ